MNLLSGKSIILIREFHLTKKDVHFLIVHSVIKIRIHNYSFQFSFIKVQSYQREDQLKISAKKLQHNYKTHTHNQHTEITKKRLLKIITAHQICSCYTPKSREVFVCCKKLVKVSNITRRNSETNIINQGRAKIRS